jgi:glycosyltransferase involved in cell wall biosynthesis
MPFPASPQVAHAEHPGSEVEAAPLISVLMPVYNARRYLAEAVESILNQTFGDFEFLIVDDGSTDDSAEILRGFAARDARIRLVSRPNTGYLVALNEMLGKARGELIARMDADDIALPDRFERQVAFLRDNPDHLVVGCRVLLIDPEGDPLCEWNFDQTHEEIDAAHLDGSRGGVISHPSAMMRCQAVRDLGGYRAEYYTSEDLDLWLRLAERGRLANLPEVLLKYRMHPTSICHTMSTTQNAVSPKAIADALRRRGLPLHEVKPPGETRVLQRSEYNLRWGWWALASGHMATARKHARARLSRAPLSFDSWRLLYCAIRGH